MMSLLKGSTRSSFCRVACWLALIMVAGCTDSMVILESVPTRIIGMAGNGVQESEGFWQDFHGGRMHINSFNSITLESQARIAGIPVEGNRLGHYTLGSRPFVIEITFDLDADSKFVVSKPVLTVDGKDFEGHALKSASNRHCVDQADRKFEEVPIGQTLGNEPAGLEGAFCVHYEFPIDPVYPDTSFSVDFGIFELKGEDYPLRIEFEGVKRTIRTSL